MNFLFLRNFEYHYFSWIFQAWVDINCLRSALRPYLSKASRDYLDEASKPLLDLERPGDSEIVKACEAEFQQRMKYHMYALNNDLLWLKIQLLFLLFLSI